MARYGASQTKACALLRISRSLYNYRSRARDARPLVQRIKEIAATRVHYGYRRVHVLLRREGWRDNCKRVTLPRFHVHQTYAARAASSYWTGDR